MANDITVVREYLGPEASDQVAQTTQHSSEEGITIGRWDGGPEGTDQPCEIILDHPSVSRIHAGINQLDGQYYIINLTEKNVMRLNGKWLKPEQADILADGDILRVGPFVVTVARKKNDLVLTVLREEQAAAHRGLGSSMTASVADLLKEREEAKAVAAAGTPSVQESQNVIDVFWKRRQKREKAARPSPLHPKVPPRPGKVRWNWQPTRDLTRPWPFSVFIWGTVAIAVFGIITAVAFANVYSPAPLSDPHQRGNFLLAANGKIANKANENSCLTCHVPFGKQTVDQKCSECHQAEGFKSSNPQKHLAAGIVCTTCHQEHQGAAYQPKADSFASCANCHNDANQSLYGPNKAQVSTPHRETYGYPVKLGKWVWMGLEPEVLKLKPDVVAILDRYKQTHSKNEPLTRQQELNWQFHAIHMYRIKAVPGVEGIKDGVLSCSSCHKQTYPNLDRNTPILVCAKCHNGYFDALVKKQWVDEGKPNCTSCHVQHYDDKYRWGDLLVDDARKLRLESIDKDETKVIEQILGKQP